MQNNNCPNRIIIRFKNHTNLNLKSAGVQLNDTGFIKVNEFKETNVEDIFALGDVCGVAMLTPGKSYK